MWLAKTVSEKGEKVDINHDEILALHEAKEIMEKNLIIKQKEIDSTAK